MSQIVLHRTQQALEHLKQLGVPELPQAEAKLTEAETLHRLKRAEVERTGYVDHANLGRMIANSMATVGGDSGESAVNGAKEKVLVQQALKDVGQLIEDRYGDASGLKSALRKLPSSGIDVLQLALDAGNVLVSPSQLREMLSTKLGLSAEEATRLVDTFARIAARHQSANREKVAAGEGEYSALVAHTASKVVEAVERRLGEGSLTIESLDKMKAYVQGVLPSIGVDLFDKPDPRQLQGVAFYVETGNEPEFHNVRQMRSALHQLLGAIQYDLHSQGA